MEIIPYKFYFLGEEAFKKLLDSFSKNSNYEIKVSTIGLLCNFNAQKNECLLNFEKETIILEFARIEKTFKYNTEDYFYVYGNLKVLKN